MSAKFGLFFMLVMGAVNSFACSIQVMDTYTKNLLMAHAANFNDLSLANVSNISVANFARSFSTGEALGSCPDYLFEEGRVSFSHSPSANRHCSYSVTVKMKNYMGEEMPEGPIQEIDFENPVAACSITLSGLKLPIKVRLKKPIIIKPPHFP